MAYAVHNALQKSQVKDSVRVMCFDTTTSNTGRKLALPNVSENNGNIWQRKNLKPL